MAISLKYANVERERKFLVARIPAGVNGKKAIVDRYISGTRLRLREETTDDGTRIRKLGHKVRLTDGPEEVACTNFYVNDDEWNLLCALPAQLLRKTRHMVHRDGLLVVVDELDDGTLLAEIDDGDHPSDFVPEWLEVTAVVTQDERWTGARLAQ